MQKLYISFDPKYMKCPEQISPQRPKTNKWLPEAERKREWGVTP